ncbi:MAG: hypothetical protein AAF865_17970 [Pseudomonadota bacterium]
MDDVTKRLAGLEDRVQTLRDNWNKMMGAIAVAAFLGLGSFIWSAFLQPTPSERELTRVASAEIARIGEASESEISGLQIRASELASSLDAISFTEPFFVCQLYRPDTGHEWLVTVLLPTDGRELCEKLRQVQNQDKDKDWNARAACLDGERTVPNWDYNLRGFSC